MSYIISLPTFKDNDGALTVVEKILPFEIKRVYYIYNALNRRGGHRHKKCIQALICIGGSCKININDGKKKKSVLLDSAEKMSNFRSRRLAYYG